MRSLQVPIPSKWGAFIQQSSRILCYPWFSPWGQCSGPRWRYTRTGCCWTWGPQILQDRSLPCGTREMKTVGRMEPNHTVITHYLHMLGGHTWRSDCAEVLRRAPSLCPRRRSIHPCAPRVARWQSPWGTKIMINKWLQALTVRQNSLLPLPS